MKKTLYLNKVNKIKIDKICKNQTKAYKIKKMIKYRSLIKEIRIKKKNKNRKKKVINHFGLSFSHWISLIKKFEINISLFK
jgi:hypothetical protein